MSRYQPYSRREFRGLFRRWRRRNLGLLSGLTAGLVALLGLVTVLLVVVTSPTPFTWWLLGAMQAGAIVSYTFMVHAAFLAHDADAILQLRGAWGEDNTRDALKRAKRRGLVWGSVDSINLQNGDIDHLVVTRHGGLVVIDTKWRNHANDTLDMAKAARKAKVRAEALAHSLLNRERGARHRSRESPLQVTPLVVIWGGIQQTVPAGARVDGIEFIQGRDLVRWLENLNNSPVSKPAAMDLLTRLETFRADAWEATSTR